MSLLESGELCYTKAIINQSINLSIILSQHHFPSPNPCSSLYIIIPTSLPNSKPLFIFLLCYPNITSQVQNSVHLSILLSQHHFPSAKLCPSLCIIILTSHPKCKTLSISLYYYPNITSQVQNSVHLSILLSIITSQLQNSVHLSILLS